MLASLTLRDFAIVERLTVEWEPGLTVLTGETGAGKSILIDAVGALLGDKVGPTDVRAGASRAFLEAIFALDPRAPEAEPLRAELDELGLELEDSTLIVAREVAGDAGGRSLARIAGRAVPLASLGRVGQVLVDIHGQSQHLSLLRAREQLEQLDRYAGLQSERSAIATLARAVRQVRERIRALEEEQRATLREQDLLRFQVDEIGAAHIHPDEETQLQARRSRLRNLERLRNAMLDALQALVGGEEASGAVDLVGRALKASQQAARLDASLAPRVEQLLAVEAEIQDGERALRAYLEELEADPAELERIEERALLLAELKRKYGATLSDVLAYLEGAQRRLSSLEHGDEELAALRDEECRTVERAAQVARNLAQRRRLAAKELQEAVERELRDLGMVTAELRVRFEVVEDRDGLPVALDDRPVSALRFDSTGVDRVEFLLAANPGTEPRPLAQVASGGELARVSLAIKTVLSAGDARGTLIFDEVDVGVGGRTAGVVGRKLWALARTHQVLCVTHLPQVAAYADSHLLVSKQVRDGKSQTQVARLEAEARVAELAAMLAGPQPSETALRNARELLDRARAEKDRSGPLPKERPA